MSGSVIFFMVIIPILCLSQACPVHKPCICEKIGEKYVANCRYKGLGMIPRFYSNASVDLLDLEGNFISTIESMQLVQIRPKVINLKGNPIRSIDNNAFANVSNSLEGLDLRDNKGQLKFIPTKALSVLFNMVDLKLSVWHVHNVPNGAFPRLPKLAHLEFYGVNTNAIGDKAFTSIGDNLKYLRLRISASSFSKYFPVAVQSLKKLETLVLSNSRLTTIPPSAFIGMTNLKKLVLNDNDFSKSYAFNDDSFQYLDKSLETLSLYNTNLPSIPVAALSRLKRLNTLNLGQNVIRQINPNDFYNLNSLINLKLDGSPPFMKFQSASFAGLESRLESLSLMNCGLTKIPRDKLIHLRALKYLYLGYNKITTLPAKAASGLSVRYFDLTKNDMTNISANAFDPKSDNLISLNLWRNKITKVDFIRDPCFFRDVNLEDNPIECDCTLFKMIERRGASFFGKCEAPMKYTGLKIADAHKRARLSCPRDKRPLCQPSRMMSGAHTRTIAGYIVALFVALTLII